MELQYGNRSRASETATNVRQGVETVRRFLDRVTSKHDFARISEKLKVIEREAETISPADGANLN